RQRRTRSADSVDQTSQEAVHKDALQTIGCEEEERASRRKAVRFARQSDARVMSDEIPRESSESEDTIRDRVVRLAFGGDQSRFDDFVRALDEATPAGVQVILRG